MECLNKWDQSYRPDWGQTREIIAVFEGEESEMNVNHNKYGGFGVLGWLITIPIVMLVPLIVVAGFYEGRKAYWDSKVKELCKQDGGVTVYERVTIDEEEFKRLGGIQGTLPVPNERYARQSYPYVSQEMRTRIREWNPEVVRGETLIKRRVDNKLLGRLIYYARIGGDIPISFGHPTYFSCQNIPEIRLDIERQIFSIEGVSK